MKKMKKVMALLLSLVMVLAMSVVAFATEPTSPATSGTYTITAPAGTDHTYGIYQIFTGDLSGTTLSNLKWGANSKRAEGVNVGDDVDASVIDVLTAVNSAANDTAKLAVIENYVDLDSAPVKTISDKAIYSAQAGYYLIKDNASLIGKDEAYTKYIVAVVGDLTITPKSVKPSVDKQVQDEVADAEEGADSEGWGESADHAINESFKFKLIATLPASTHYNDYQKYAVKFTDTMSAGVTFESIKSVTVDSIAVDANGYTCSATAGQAGGDWTLFIEDLKTISGVDLTDGAEVEVVYNAHLNEKATVNQTTGTTDNENTVSLEYSNNPNVGGEGNMGKTPEDHVWVFTYEVDNTKVDQNKDPLPGAGFRLYKGTNTSNEVELIYDDTLKAYRPVKGSEVAQEMTSADTTGKFNIVGLDAGTYTLVETTTPAGYNTCAPITITIEATHKEAATRDSATTTIDNDKSTMTNEVINMSGSTLPTTGGMGTTIFYVVGSILVLGAAILLITKKRMSAR